MESLNVSDHTSRGQDSGLRELGGLALDSGHNVVAGRHSGVSGDSDEVSSRNSYNQKKETEKW